MSTAIINFLLKNGGSYLWEYTNHGKFTEARNQWGEILKSQDAMLQDMKSMHFEGVLWSDIEKIAYWTKQLDVALEKEQKAQDSGKVNDDPTSKYISHDMRKLIEALDSAGDGVGYHMSSLESGLTGKNGIAGTDGLIGVWVKNAHNNMADLDNLKYTIKDFLVEIENHLTAVSKIFRNASLLQSLIAEDDAERAKWAKESADIIVAMQNKAYSYFPAALKRFKPSYTGAFISEMHWWRVELSHKRGTFWSFHPNHPFRASSISEWRVDPNPCCEFRFAGAFAKLDANGVVAEDDKTTSRLVPMRSRMGDDRVGSQWRVAGFTTNKDGAKDFMPILFKVVPLLDTAEPAVRFAIKRESTNEMVRENGRWKYFGTSWDDVYILRDEGVLESDYVAPAQDESGCIIS